MQSATRPPGIARDSGPRRQSHLLLPKRFIIAAMMLSKKAEMSNDSRIENDMKKIGHGSGSSEQESFTTGPQKATSESRTDGR